VHSGVPIHTPADIEGGLPGGVVAGAHPFPAILPNAILPLAPPPPGGVMPWFNTQVRRVINGTASGYLVALMALRAVPHGAHGVNHAHNTIDGIIAFTLAPTPGPAPVAVVGGAPAPPDRAQEAVLYFLELSVMLGEAQAPGAFEIDRCRWYAKLALCVKVSVFVGREAGQAATKSAWAGVVACVVRRCSWTFTGPCRA
jgi:hypothetical protein